MANKTRRLLLPLTLIALGMWLLVGCVYIPSFGTTVEGKNAAKSVGDARSRKPVRVTRSTLEEVLRVLGEPKAATADRRVLAYPWTVRNGYAVWPLCFAAYPVKGQRTLVLRFDETEKLKSFEVLKKDEPVIQISGMIMTPLMPKEILQEQGAEGLRQREIRRAATRASTAPRTSPATRPR